MELIRCGQFSVFQSPPAPMSGRYRQVDAFTLTSTYVSIAARSDQRAILSTIRAAAFFVQSFNPRPLR